MNRLRELIADTKKPDSNRDEWYLLGRWLDTNAENIADLIDAAKAALPYTTGNFDAHNALDAAVTKLEPK